MRPDSKATRSETFSAARRVEVRSYWCVWADTGQQGGNHGAVDQDVSVDGTVTCTVGVTRVQVITVPEEHHDDWFRHGGLTGDVPQGPDCLLADVQQRRSQETDEGRNGTALHHLRTTGNRTWSPMAPPLPRPGLTQTRSSVCGPGFPAFPPSRTYLLCVPGGSRGHVGEGPGRLELQCGFLVQRQEVHEAGQQPGVDDLLQGRVPLLGEQLPGGGVEGKNWTLKDLCLVS